MDKDNLSIRYRNLASSQLTNDQKRRRLRLRLPMLEYIAGQPPLRGLSHVTPDAALLSMAETISHQRPKSNTLIDQCPITPDDMVTRCKIVREYLLPLAGKHILFVGDDDLVSPLLAREHSTSITLVDIDDRILNFVKKYARKFGASRRMRTFQANIVDIVDKHQADIIEDQLFDAIVTDPPYTENGYYYFLKFGLSHLRLSGRAFIAVPHMNLEQWTDELLYKVEEFLIANGMVIEELLPGFSLYEHEEGVVSSMVVAKRISVANSVAFPLRANRLYTTGIQPDQATETFEQGGARS